MSKKRKQSFAAESAVTQRSFFFIKLYFYFGSSLTQESPLPPQDPPKLPKGNPLVDSCEEPRLHAHIKLLVSTPHHHHHHTPTYLLLDGGVTLWSHISGSPSRKHP